MSNEFLLSIPLFYKAVVLKGEIRCSSVLGLSVLGYVYTVADPGEGPPPYF